MPLATKQTLTVLFGGRSSEHEISLRSAVFALQNIPLEFNIIPVGINRNGEMFSLEGTFQSTDFKQTTTQDLAAIVAGKSVETLNQAKCVPTLFLPLQKSCIDSNKFPYFKILNLHVSCVVPILHGTNGEDGRLQALCELAEIAYVGCDLRSSVVGIDKDIQKRLAACAHIPIAKYEAVSVFDFEHHFSHVYEKVIHTCKLPCFVKPNSNGSTIGTGIARNKEELFLKLKEAFVYDSVALVEELLQGAEIECAFLGTSSEPLITVPGEIRNDTYYSYEEKYNASSKAQVYIPARLTEAQLKEVQRIATLVAQTLKPSGLSRIDFFFLEKENRFVFNEINTLPGMTSISMYPKLLEYSGVTAEKWMGELIALAYARQAKNASMQYGIKPEL